ncbi:hypothetical protein NEOKW01_1504 [Nematocida sp. AWRm80]|nr:hypothetical protein NEOKW01_1504 [Nematocida sp. AWRm80]
MVFQQSLSIEEVFESASLEHFGLTLVFIGLGYIVLVGLELAGLKVFSIFVTERIASLISLCIMSILVCGFLYPYFSKVLFQLKSIHKKDNQ